MNHKALLLAAVLGSGLFVLTAQQPTPSGAFTAAQAEAGRAAYGSTCGKCHTATLRGRKGEPGELPPVSSLPASYREFIKGSSVGVRPLVGAEFLNRWGSHTAAELIRQIGETVEAFPPDGKNDDTPVNITAYVLQSNGAKAGSQPLNRATWVVINSITADRASVGNSMPLAQQDALVKKYCVVCHNDRKLVGGMSLEHFDPAHPDPSIAGMMVSKLTSGAMGAAGVPLPDPATEKALIEALRAEEAGAEAATGGWAIKSNASPLPPPPPPTVTASMFREVSSPANDGLATVYRLTVDCVKTIDTSEAGTASASHPAEMKLTADRAAEAGSVPFAYDVDGVTGSSSIRYVTTPNSSSVNFVMPLPSHSLTIRNLFPDETVTFPFDGLNPDLRRILSTCLSHEPAR
jgi:cytochrome c553